MRICLWRKTCNDQILNTVVNTFQWISPVLGTGMAKYLIEERVREELISGVLLLSTKRTSIEKNASPFYIFLCKMQTKKNNTHKKSLPLEAGTIPNHKLWNNTMKFRPSRGGGGKGCWEKIKYTQRAEPPKINGMTARDTCYNFLHGTGKYEVTGGWQKHPWALFYSRG